jgi:hypothetical protein
MATTDEFPRASRFYLQMLFWRVRMPGAIVLGKTQ